MRFTGTVAINVRKFKKGVDLEGVYGHLSDDKFLCTSMVSQGVEPAYSIHGQKGIRKMSKETVVIFKPYPFEVGQKIYIEEGPRRGDWEVVGVTDRKLNLRCPISKREVEWDRFCYFVSKDENSPWPHPD